MKKAVSDEGKAEEKEVLRFKVHFTGMTEEDYAFLRSLAEEMKAKKAAEKESKRSRRKAS